MSFTRLLTQLDPDPRRRGRQFERICAWYLRNALEYRGRFKKVWLWADWPGGPLLGSTYVEWDHSRGGANGAGMTS